MPESVVILPKLYSRLDTFIYYLRLTPKINFSFYEINAEQGVVILLEIERAFRHPVQFKGVEYVRIGSYTKPLKAFPEKERQLWRIFDTTPFEDLFAIDNIDADAVLRFLDYPAYLHACLKYVQRDYLTNSSLRERFGIKKENSAMVSRIIKEALENKAIKFPDPESESRKYARYVPVWA